MKLVLLLAVAGTAGFGQSQSPSPTPGTGPATPPGGGSPGTPSITRGSAGTMTSGGGHSGQTYDPTSPQPLWLELALSGRVALEDGAPPPEPVAVAFSCVGPKPLGEPGTDRFALTDGRGRFLLVAGLNNMPGTPQTRGGFSTPRLQGCAVAIRVPGYAPFQRELGRVVSLAEMDLGVIRLRRLGQGGAGVTMSKTSISAPQKARREYAAAMSDAYSRRDTEALVRLETATGLYAGYAAAHYLAGYLYDRTVQRERARQSYRKAAAADPLYVNPLVQLAQMAAEERDFDEAARLSARVIDLMPGAYGEIYVVAAGAMLNREDLKGAESTARAAVAARLDTESPRLHLVLGEVLWKQKRYVEARREFLQFAEAVKDGPEVELARQKAAEAVRLVPKS